MKLLIPEKRLATGENPGAHLLRLKRRKNDEDAVEIEVKVPDGTVATGVKRVSKGVLRGDYADPRQPRHFRSTEVFRTSFPDLRTFLWAADCGSGIMDGRVDWRKKAESRERKAEWDLAAFGWPLFAHSASRLAMIHHLHPSVPQRSSLEPETLLNLKPETPASTRRCGQRRSVMHESRIAVALKPHGSA
jgi:hypothetical protein